MDIDWTPELVKELLWRTAQKAITGKDSTTQLDKVEDINIIYEHLNRHLGQLFGIHVPFPHDAKKKENEGIEHIKALHKEMYKDLDIPKGKSAL